MRSQRLRVPSRPNAQTEVRNQDIPSLGGSTNTVWMTADMADTDL